MGLVIALLLATLTFFCYKTWRSSKAATFPPGPGCLPVIGSVHHVPFGYQQHAFLEWKKTYGDVIYLQIFNKPAIVLNSTKVIDDLLEKRGSKYSDRPRSVLISEMIGFTNNITVMPYGDQWRRQRRWFKTAFQAASALESYVSLQRRESVRLLVGILDMQKNSEGRSGLETGAMVFSCVKRYVGAMMMEIAYGHSVASLDDEFVMLSERAIDGTVEAGTSIASLVDFFPFLRFLPQWMPGASILAKVAEVRELVREMIDVPFERVQASFANGLARPCFLTSLLDECTNNGQISEYDKADVKGAANIVYGAGTDTTATVLTSFLLAVVLHPDALEKVQQEFDSVVGQERLPEFEDRESLPYFEALLKEVYRWNPPVPLVIPHRVTEDDVYGSYTIPGGSVIMPNLWAMAREPECYSEPNVFKPERFLSATPERDPRDFAFGFGRRSCPGKMFGDLSVWLAAARIVAMFDVTKARDPASGMEISVTPEFASGMISHVKQFPFDVRPRSGRVVTLIRELEAEH